VQYVKQAVVLMGSASHVAGGLVIFFACFIPLTLARVRQAHWIGAALAIGYYWGRETRDHEGRLRLPPLEVFHYSWMPWHWSHKSMLDLAYPTVTVLVLAIAIELWRRRRGG
jgi:hypothetical protein